MKTLESTPPGVVPFAAVSMSEAPAQSSEMVARWSALPVRILDGGEIVLLAVKPSMWRPVLDSASVLAATCVVAVMLVALRAPIPGLSLTLTAEIILLSGLMRLGFAVARWIPAWYVLTNRRVLDIRGVRAPRVWSCPLLGVRNTYVHTPFFEKCLGLGTIAFATDQPTDPPRLWQSVVKPNVVHDKIRRAIEQAIDLPDVA